MHDQTGLAWQHGTRVQSVRCQSTALVQLLPENYPHPVSFRDIMAGCSMPDENPDLPLLIRRHRQDHVAFWKAHPEDGPHRIEEAEAGLIASGRRDLLLIGAGWSAGENMALVRRWIGLKKPIVIAVNRAGVCWPDSDVFFITERQANPYWWKHANPDAICIIVPSTNPELLNHFKLTQYAYFGTPWCFHDKWPDAPDWAVKPPLMCLPACETTMSMALAWTVRLQPLRIILLGVDHCWPAYMTNHDNTWLPGPYYCDGYLWNGPEGVIRRVTRGINGRYVACNHFNENQVLIFKRSCQQIQVNSALAEPPTIINASGHGLLDFNEDSLLFMRELDEAMALDTANEGEALIKARTELSAVAEPSSIPQPAPASILSPSGSESMMIPSETPVRLG